MDDVFEEINYYILLAILRTQTDILRRLGEVRMLVARPPLRVYRPVKEADHR